MGGQAGPEPTALDAGAPLPAICISQDPCFNNKSADLTDEGLPVSRWGSSCQDSPISRAGPCSRVPPSASQKGTGPRWGLPLVADRP